MRSLKDHSMNELLRELANARNARDAFAAGREPDEVLRRVGRAQREVERRRRIARAGR
jgi:hypothetical protein